MYPGPHHQKTQKEAVDLTSACMQACHLKKINKILLQVNFKLHMLAELWNPLSQAQGLYVVSPQPCIYLKLLILG